MLPLALAQGPLQTQPSLCCTAGHTNTLDFLPTPVLSILKVCHVHTPRRYGLLGDLPFSLGESLFLQSNQYWLELEEALKATDSAV